MTFLVGKHPFITLQVKLPRNKWLKLDCLIDTGFSGGLVMPEKYKHQFPPGTFIEAHFILADGSEVTAETTYTQVKFDGKKKEVAVVFMGDSDNLVGVEFLVSSTPFFKNTVCVF